MRRLSFLYKYLAWGTPAVIVAAVLALMLISPQTVIARGGSADGGGGQPTASATPDDTGGPPEGKGEDEGGNNLSFPVIWSDDQSLSLRGTFGAPEFNGEFFTDEFGVDWYLQQDEFNEWQAESANLSGSQVYVDWIDWGDNLEAKDWSLNSVVRVETVLYQDLDPPMTGFVMTHLWGQGPDEMWGCSTLTFDSDQATVYSACARLTIQKLADDYSNDDLSWNAGTGEWEGIDIGLTLFNSGVWEGVHGPDSRETYSAEINVPGKAIYGYNWNVRRNNDGIGYYRITFSLDETNPPHNLNTFFYYNTEEDKTRIMPSTEGGEDSEAEPGGGGIAVINYDYNLTYIDIYIQDSSGGADGDGGNGPEDPGGYGPGGDGRR